MRPSSKIAFVSMFMAMMFGCAGPFSNLQRAEQAYTQSEAERKKQEEEAWAAQAQADIARQAEVTAKEGFATALVQSATEREQYVQDELERAKADRKRACELNPKLDICKAEPPPANPPQAAQPVPPPPQANPAPAPVPPTQAPPAAAAPPAPATDPAEPPFIDIKMNDFSAKGMQRLTPLPVGWEVGYDASKGNIFLEIKGTRKYEYSKPAQFRAGICYRFLEEKLIVCPAATGSVVQPRSGPQPGISP